MSATRIGIVGAGGRMGRMLIEACLQDEQLSLGAVFDRPGSPVLGKTAGELVGMASEVIVTDDLAGGLKHIDCLIDFTRPQGTLLHLELCRKAGVGILDEAGFERKAESIPLTRSKQNRNLDELAGWVKKLRALPINCISTGTTNFQTFSEVAFSFRISPEVVMFALGLSLFAGVMGGLIPAVRAARLPITTALREI